MNTEKVTERPHPMHGSDVMRGARRAASTRWLIPGLILLVSAGSGRVRAQEIPDMAPEPPPPGIPVDLIPEPPPPPGPAEEAGRTTLDALLPPNNGVHERISITLADVELSEAVSLFIRLSGANIIASPSDLVGRVTVSLKDVPWQEALGSILDLHSLVLERTSLDADLYKIVPRPEGAPEPMFIESFSLQFTRSEPLMPGIKSLLEPNGRLLFAEGNMISILGTTRQVERVRGMIERVDQRVPQVVIEAKFVELNDRAIRDLGVNWQSLQGFTASVRPSGAWERTDTRTRLAQDASAAHTADHRMRESVSRETGRTHTDSRGSSDGGLRIWGENFTDVDFGDGSMTTVPQREIVSTGAVSALLSADEFAMTLSALQSNRGVGIISNPKIIVASGQQASIHVGRQDPEIRAVADTNLGGRLTYQRDGWIESGVRVEVTPVVNTEEIISVQIRPELSRVIDFQESGDTRVRIPILSTRTISSQFQLPSGKTVAIGGLTESTESETVSKIPFLGDLPIIGRLFRHESTEREQEEVIIFVTLALAETATLERESGIPTQGHLIHQSVQTDEDGTLRFATPESRRRARRGGLHPDQPVPRR